MATAEAKRAAVAATAPIMVPTIHRMMRASIKATSDRTRSTSTRRRSTSTRTSANAELTAVRPSCKGVIRSSDSVKVVIGYFFYLCV